jgi:Xaa-Pro aminopeptidase
VVEKLRIRKDASEIAAIREAISIAEKAFARWSASLRPADTEKQLGDRIEMLIREEGGKCSSFPPIVGVGARAALPHAPLGGTRLDEGELVLVDWGAKGRFYMSDLTRVLANRKISPKLAEVHAAVCRAQSRAIARICPGAVAQDIDAEARAALNEVGLAEFFTHGLGHGFGLEIHEAPFLRPNSPVVLEPGMVVTVEPGVYLPDWGGVRIEDDVLVTPNGCQVLTSLSRELLETRS